MKKITTLLFILLLFSLTTNGQENYKTLWQKVQNLEIDNLPKSALRVVNEIYGKARKENNDAQLIKTLFYKSKFALLLEENAQLEVINSFKKHISESKFPTKNVLENILANLYWQYFKKHRYQFYNRTKTKIKVDTNDFRTWDVNTLFKEIHIHYQSSLKERIPLLKTNVYNYADILQVQKGAKTYRPTLFDFLAHNALKFYKTSETSITKPTYQFKIDNPNLLQDAEAFSLLNINTKDTLSLQLNALKIYQNLILTHIPNNDKRALVHIDLERLLFIKGRATFSNRDAFYLKVLKASREIYKTKEVGALYAFKIAQIYHQKAKSYSSNKEKENRFKNKEAIIICDQILKNFPGSLGAKKCEILKSQIEQKSLNISAEKYIPINTNSRLLIHYKNMNRLYFTSYKINQKDLIAFQKIYKDIEKIKFIKKLKKNKSWNSKLRNEGDYLEHTTEVIVPKFDGGSYLVVASENIDLNPEKIFGTCSIQSTNLALIENNFGRKNNYQVVDRNTGEPIKNASIHVKNYSLNRYNKLIDRKLITNKNGFASFKTKNRYKNVKIRVNNKKDSAVFGNYYLYNQTRNISKKEDEEIVIHPFTFTDRSIYRPGQTAYFKVIVIKKQGTTSEVFKNEHVEVTLRDVNNQAVKTLNLKLNEFGSVAGEFIIPNNGLTGKFFIEVDESNEYKSTFYDSANYDFHYNNSTSISVEEYKRPKFAVEFKPISEAYTLNDSITIKGFAKAFSGGNITEAKVVYRVHRKVQYPSWYYWRKPSFNSEAQEITHGETSTDASGNFSIQFKAVADESVLKESSPVFTYEISADVTDINGESHSITSNIKVGYHSLLATISVDNKIDKNQKNNNITVDTKNLNGEFVPSKGSIKIYKLDTPKNPLRKRVWPAPEYQDISESKFRTLFPNQPYTNEESNGSNWKKGALVFETNFDTSKSKEIKLESIKKWISGKYIVTLESEDTFGQKVKDEQRFILFSTKEKSVADNALFKINTDKSSYKPSGEVELQIGSASKNITVIVQVEKNHKIVETYLVHLNNQTKTLKIPVTKKDIGGFSIKYHFVNYNYFESGNLLIKVPKIKNNINIETNIFRDKLLPGQNETWSFTIKNDKNDEIAAEVLASMYDASLDQFKPHNWQFNPVFQKTYYSYNTSSANHSFGTRSFQVRNNQRNYYGFPTHKFDSYNWFGFNLNNNRWIHQQYLRNIKRKINSSRTEFDGTITGVLEDESGYLPGVSIRIKGTNFGTETDFDGNYSIRVKKGDVLVFRYLGFSPKEIVIGNQTILDVQLEENSDTLDEIVVTAYATEQKEEADIAKVLSGKVAGLSSRMKIRGTSSITGNQQPLYIVDGIAVNKFNINENEIIQMTVLKNADATAKYGDRGVHGVVIITTKFGKSKLDRELSSVKARKNLQETAFFYPQLRTDKNGKISFNFSVPEALTKWKLQILAHTADLKSTTKTATIVTQKELMVVPNAPRFLREKDTISLSAKITNLTNNQLSGFAQLQVTDAITGKEINTDLGNTNKTKNFTVDKDGNTNVSWNLSIPESVQAVQYKVVAKAGDFSDGEQNMLPVLSNRILVTETLPMWVGSNETKTFTLKKLKNNSSSTLQNHKLTLEITSNPAWYALQALPYLMEYPYECSEQTFSRYYANTLASFITSTNPRIQEVVNSWKSSDALLSNLEKNKTLKSLIIQETPWLRDAQSETEQKKRIALLFDLTKMKNEQEKSINTLKKMQMPSGGFPWFKGGKTPSAFVTQHIAAGFGHLKKLGVSKFNSTTKKMIVKAVRFLDDEIVEKYDKIVKKAANIKAEKSQEKYEEYLAQNHLNYFELHYLYVRSFYADISIDDSTKIAVDYYKNQTTKYWKEFNIYGKGQIALIQFRNGDKKVARQVLNSLKENSISSNELGMYWKENIAGFYNYQAPVETQALLIEAFSEIENNTKTIDNLKIWLLKNKQTNRWKTTKATTEAIYALLLNGSDWISNTNRIDIKIGNQKIEPTKTENTKVEAGTGYFKTSWNNSQIKPDMSEVSIKKKGEGIAWGGLYWQYFEDLEKVTSSATPLQLKKKLFLKVHSDTGKELREITDKVRLKVGDLVTVRIELRSDRDLEFIHMKDMRASGVEPTNVLSKYKWQDGLGYYESTKDAATHFFFDRLPKGVYIFEYDVRLNNAGDFSNGVSTIQSMYAPEFTSHSKGGRIQIEEK